MTWHDLSHEYLRRAKARAQAAGVDVDYSVGYLESAIRFKDRPFDLVFNRVCWCYGVSDSKLGKVLWNITAPGGAIYVAVDVEAEKDYRPRLSTSLRTRLYHASGIRIGHPFPPRGKVATVFLKYPVKSLSVSYRTGLKGRVIEETLVQK